MKKIWVYILGILTGMIITFIALSIIGKSINQENTPTKSNPEGMTFFESPKEIINESSFKVIQALEDGVALAEGKGEGDSYIYLGIHAVLFNEEGIPYYDEQVVTIPKGKCFRQVGLYRYTSHNGQNRTLPIIMIMDK